MDVFVRFEDEDDADRLARTFLKDIGASDGIGAAQLGMLTASAVEKGLIEDIGLVAVSIVDAVGVGHLLDILKMLLPKRREPGSDDRKAILTLPDGTHLELQGAMSDAAFAKTRDQLIKIIKETRPGAAP